MQNTFLPSSELKWLFFDLNSYFASVEQQENPHLRGKPIAVVPMMTDATCAIAASYEAKAYGIKTGTKIYDAKKACPDLQCVLARHDVYVDYHHRIFQELENHLHVTKICSIDEAACLLLGEERKRENAVKLAYQIKAGLRDNVGSAIQCSIGVAPNAFLAKVATDMQKPDGLTVLEPDSFQHKLFKLRLRDLCGIGHNMEKRLNDAGIHTVEQFWNLPPKHARNIWGSVGGEQFWYKLHGFEVPSKEATKSVIGHSRVLEPSLRPPDKALAITRQLTVKAASRLRRYELYSKRLSLKVHSIDKIRWADDRSFSPAQDDFTFTRALNGMWGRMLRDLGGKPLLKVSIAISELYEPNDVTLDLFAISQPKALENKALSGGMDRINKKYGANTISIGSCPKTSSGHVGTKIAFTRIPEQSEFDE